MGRTFFDQPILNSPYEVPGRHWKLDAAGQPTDEIVASRRDAEFLSPVPAPKHGPQSQLRLALGDESLSTAEQQYNPYPVINRIRGEVARWRALPEARWRVTPETARLLKHWRHHDFRGHRPFFCQVEAVETAIWLVEVLGVLRPSDAGIPARLRGIRSHLIGANRSANPDLLRLALKMATGAGKTTVMAMLIAWQTVNAVRHPARRNFTRGFLVMTPGIPIRDRLRVLLPNDPDSGYQRRELAPRDMLADLGRARIVVTNFQAFQRRERMTLAKGTRALLRGRGGEPATRETEGEMLRRVMCDLMGMERILVLNDEGHHCYREKAGASAEGDLVGEDRDEATKNTRKARIWISAIEAARRTIGVPVVFDLSATPFFLRGSGYAEGTLFPWTVSDFSLMDAIESGIVKLPRVPVSDDVAPDDMPRLRNLWEHIGKDLPRKGRRKKKSGGDLDPQLLPPLLETALHALHSHYRRTFESWREAGIVTPPVMIVVCNNTATSKLLYDYIAGWERTRDDGTVEFQNGRLESFRNYEEDGRRLARPRTLLIDSEQLESGDALDKTFREAAKDQIERFRREIVDRTGSREKAETITDAALLREVVNTVGKPGRLGEDIRCVVSVQMLSEGWDANTVTHILGIRAFGTQLLCEQVVGRSLRRQSYESNDDGLFDPEYADVLGIPFDFTAKPTVVKPTKPQPVAHVHAVLPEREGLEIRFPRVQGYRQELPDDRLAAAFTADSKLTLTPELVGPAETENRGIVGLPVKLRPDWIQGVRPATIAFHLAHDLIRRHLRSPDEEPHLHLFGHARRIARRWLDECLDCRGNTHPGQVLYEQIAATACEKIHAAISLSTGTERPVLAVLDPYNPVGSTSAVNYRTARRDLWRADERKSPVNLAVCDSSWEREFCRVVEAHPRTAAYVKNAGLGFEVPYRLAGESRRYLPDFIVRVRDDDAAAIHLVVEIKGLRGEDAKAKAETMQAHWVPGVNNLGTFGVWNFLELRNIENMEADFGAFVDLVTMRRQAA